MTDIIFVVVCVCVSLVNKVKREKPTRNDDTWSDAIIIAIYI